ncbi:MAG: UDP-N-acetylmuramate:L-alanyl-gamma-D-glutamyl-meso-diaminopimelate ligase [Halothiobacillaceae bacterium]|jgi:UDP-N-acetylmuramate: L-alanyl-gamma-D-glutamyl-meso-diaminopimelate ligase|nr:UDP-N-acetylmuramate:L-alanyl-gamma-D-glutamyl-meso-diaminopimelate ligase [Halothiobacillaceae bacterium]HQS02843.1 UDP-N-acetylmuramate:L-alanyl-gamma-D-glutamyl-meso-diaminopimelate ligase [Halothiobacillus sp.]HQS29230.1 UDP-N-acetylmuramate:L-alanyl-gamma-D-glutamyl-meso-diaminopimelate ligase [Halothiobacillus sp.]HUN00610.1 UDP-N-acetylmuramate:L-alanyl-gamma-D-glutamyl-meso-diaminopimelate ligase [Halothiobacillus sp.]
MKKIHILGIAGTFMGSLAQLAKAMGFEVSGRDHAIYPPMSDQLEKAGIPVQTDMDAPLPQDAEIIVGNVMRRDRPVINELLSGFFRYRSGPQWLGEELLCDKFVLAVAGTHGKTTTSSMLACILDAAGMQPGFLIGGVPANFGVSARLGQTPFFVIEADEYDTAFFDKRSKFLHYRPRGVILNNLEFDHADIFPDLAAIERQFAHFLRLVPNQGLVVMAADTPALERVLAQGVWSPVARFGRTDTAQPWRLDGRTVWLEGAVLGDMPPCIVGAHNQRNALAALALARFAGVPPEQGLAALAQFKGVARRLQNLGTAAGVTVFDDFAHHPTAIFETIAALKAHLAQMQQTGRVIAVVDPRSNTMRAGVHQTVLADALQAADSIVFYSPPDLAWQPRVALAALGTRAQFPTSVDAVLAALLALCQPGDHVLVMSNGSFDGVHQRLLSALLAGSAGLAAVN